MLKIWMLVLMFILTGCGGTELEEIPLDDTVIVEEEQQNINDMIYVFVCGAVENPGVYELQQGSRVFEAIQAAGGFSEEAAVNEVNQAELLEDEMKLYVPTRQELAVQAEEDSGKININKASLADLMTLPGVGEAKANQIIQYREENGAFQSIEDIMLISGIKEGLFQKIKEYITI